MAPNDMAYLPDALRIIVVRPPRSSGQLSTLSLMDTTAEPIFGVNWLAHFLQAASATQYIWSFTLGTSFSTCELEENTFPETLQGPFPL